ncbi:hypothetical protein Smar_1313 [Staphylothermus marinus F1]|uniref:Uncharacterized protein n=1 Tax=Staphylothermus marinus (strain ATCC 43588 / DSM 3639 / JCM 9404 / F1) TaxID=399550 RepID=A3DP44_STAMF|nr:hypothetical protein [Staphylothermus marinus]ABN70404.1 hypothetical protein Smar_1313 [Staphylothermus marinus F1]
MSIEQLVEKLRNIYGKIVKENQGYYYSLIIYEKNEPKYLLCVKTTNGIIYGKISLFNKISSLVCEDLLYDPNGLYIFARSIDEFVEKTQNKTKYLV